MRQASSQELPEPLLVIAATLARMGQHGRQHLSLYSEDSL